MSLITKNNRLSVKPCAFVPALNDLPAIQRPTPSVSNASSRSASRGIGAGVNLTEGCIVTKAVKYTHQLVHFVNAVRQGDPGPVQDLIDDLYILPTGNFTLGHPCNLAYLEAFLHTSLDLYGFIALTPSASTLESLISMVRSDNDRRQSQIDEEGTADRRSLNFSISSFTNPEYELVTIYPEHFLPSGSMLTVYHREIGTHTNYVASRDRRLRLMSDPRSPRLSAFRHENQTRTPRNMLNVFLVTLNAEIKFRRYFEELRVNSQSSPLPEDVIALMRACIELVDLIYWTPDPTEGSQGRAILEERIAIPPQNPPRTARPNPVNTMESPSSENAEMEDVSGSAATEPRRRRWFANANEEQRRAYGTMLMSRLDDDHNPALLEEVKDFFFRKIAHCCELNSELER